MDFHSQCVSLDQPSMDTYVLATTAWHRVTHQAIDPRLLRPYLGWRPIDIIKKTLLRTTQMAHMILRTPLRKHVTSQNPHMNVVRFNDTVSVDPMYANCKSLYHVYKGDFVWY